MAFPLEDMPGTGKTTLANALAGVNRQDEGGEKGDPAVSRLGTGERNHSFDPRSSKQPPHRLSPFSPSPLVGSGGGWLAVAMSMMRARERILSNESTTGCGTTGEAGSRRTAPASPVEYRAV